MIDDGTGLRERIKSELLAVYVHGEQGLKSPIGEIADRIAALSAVAPPPVLEGVPVGAVYRHARHSPMATLNPSPEDVALFQRDNPAWAFDHYLYAASPAAPAQAAMQAAPVAWQPIESAPKDAYEVLLTDGDDVCCGFWHDGSECYGHRGGAGWFDSGDRGSLLTASNYLATHWQALPPPPTGE